MKIPVSAVRFCPSAPVKKPAVITAGFLFYIHPYWWRLDEFMSALCLLCISLTKMIMMYTVDVYISWRPCMVRTQIYLTKRQREELNAIAKTAGKKQSELIREAVDRLIDESRWSRRETVLREAAGIWKDRKDLPDFRGMRADWDRN